MGQDLTEGLVDPFGYGLAFPDWVDVPSPAAGASASFVVDGAWSLRVLAAVATLTTDANAANRYLSLDYVNGRGTTYARNGGITLVTANNTGQAFVWSRAQGSAQTAASCPIILPVLDVFLPPGFVVRFQVDGVQAGDQLSGLHLWVEKFPTGPRGYPRGSVEQPHRRDNLAARTSA